MEQYGFARAGVPGEYSPTVVSATLTADVTSTTSFVTILTTSVTIETPGELLTLIGSVVSRQNTTGGASIIRLTVDGVDVGQANKFAPVAGAKANVRRVVVVPGLTPGPHTITLDWKNNNTSFIKAASVPQEQHAALTCQSCRVTSDREMDGFPQAGWPMIYTEPQVYEQLTSSNTSTTTTITTPLFSAVKVQTRYAQSALLIRFGASGESNDTVNELDNRYQLLVDGIARCGTGASSGSSGFAGLTSCAGFVCVVPVQAGWHELTVNWAGGASPGTTIDPSTATQHAFLCAEEVFCGDLDNLSDMEGFVAAQFASKNLPRVGFVSLQTDFTNGGTIVPLLERVFYVSGDNSAILVEFTGSLTSNGQEPVMRIVVDGVPLLACTETATVGFTQFVSVESAVNVPQGNHLVQVTMNGIASFTPATNPEFSHANMVIREIAKL